LATKPSRPGTVDINNLFPGEFVTAITSRSIQSEYKNHLKYLESLYKSLQKPSTLRNEIAKINQRDTIVRTI